MLVLSRKQNERIRIGDNIVVTVVRLSGDKVRLGVTAPDTVGVDREEVFEAKKREKATKNNSANEGRA